QMSGIASGNCVRGGAVGIGRDRDEDGCAAPSTVTSVGIASAGAFTGAASQRGSGTWRRGRSGDARVARNMETTEAESTRRRASAELFRSSRVTHRAAPSIAPDFQNTSSKAVIVLLLRVWRSEPQSACVPPGTVWRPAFREERRRRRAGSLQKTWRPGAATRSGGLSRARWQGNKGNACRRAGG